MRLKEEQFAADGENRWEGEKGWRQGAEAVQGAKGNGRANLDHVRHSGKGTMTGAVCSRISKSRWLRLL